MALKIGLKNALKIVLKMALKIGLKNGHKKAMFPSSSRFGNFSIVVLEMKSSATRV